MDINTCDSHHTNYVASNCPSCDKVKERKVNRVLSLILCFISYFFIAYNFGIIVSLCALIAGAASYLVAESKYS